MLLPPYLSRAPLAQPVPQQAAGEQMPGTDGASDARGETTNMEYELGSGTFSTK